MTTLSLYFEELDYRPTPIGALSLRRRRELSLGVDVFEIKLGDQYLMSSLFTASEIALARLGLAELSGQRLDVVVGGLGLGYTAQAVLEHAAVESLLVVEALDAVIDWHQTGLLPLGPALTKDPRCRFVSGDLFALAASKGEFANELLVAGRPLGLAFNMLEQVAFRDHWGPESIGCKDRANNTKTIGRTKRVVRAKGVGMTKGMGLTKGW